LTQKDEGSLRSDASGGVVTELEAIRLAVADFGEESIPSHVSTLQAVGWLINEHREQVRHNEELGVEHTAVVNERDTLAWLHAEAVWLKGRERYMAETYSRLHTAVVEERSWLWEFASRLEAERDALRAALADALEGMQDMVGYVGEYFREKWGHDEYIERAKAALSALADPSRDSATSEASMEEVSLDDLSGAVCGKTGERTPDACDGTCTDCTDAPPAAGEADTTPTHRLRGCVERWPDCEEGTYNPSCCRFPKSCSCTVYNPANVTDDDLEPKSPSPSQGGGADG
jgi:hypothetical protein